MPSKQEQEERKKRIAQLRQQVAEMEQHGLYDTCHHDMLKAELAAKDEKTEGEK